ncbi:transposase [Bradyrhizobium sp. 30]|nr:transposase [Bradyrhizobium sp. 30]
MVHARPCHPQGRGKDERFHHSLNSEVFARCACARSTAPLDRWRTVYNLERPHRACCGFPSRLLPPECARHASSTTSTRPPTSPKHSRRSSTAIPIAASKTSCRGDSAKRQASLNRVAAKRLRSKTTA